MYFAYNIILFFVSKLLIIIAPFNKKIRQFVDGRNYVFTELQQKINLQDRVIWIHCASLGEFEQGRPLLENLKLQFPTYKILLTFFSPSGYEVRKNYDKADVVVYLPLDRPKLVHKFLNLAHPDVAIFVKYEFWANYLHTLKERAIPTLLVSGIFRKNQLFFKFYGSGYRKILKAFTWLFVQDNQSLELLRSIGIQNCSVSGDTRFDRVYILANEKIEFPLVERFVENTKVLVAGSTWPPDEDILTAYINQHATTEEKFIIVPHEINAKAIQALQQKLQVTSVVYAELNEKNAKESKVLIVNTVGLLSKLYAYGQVSYVGGGFGVGIHNILEPATYGIPIIIGKEYQKFKEAQDLMALKACFSINDVPSFTVVYKNLIQNDIERINIGNRAKEYVKKNTGATQIIMRYLENLT